MDNLAHTLLATALAKSPLGRRSPLSSVALVVAANFPDADGVAGWIGGKGAYLIHHRGFSHSICGLLVEALFLTALFRFVERRFFAAAPTRGPALAVAIGLASHPLLDFLNSYGVRPFLPFDGRWIYGDAAFIVDPWLWALFGGATALAGARSRWGSVALALVAATTTLLIVRSDRTPPHVLWAWPAIVAAIALARIVGFGRRRPMGVLAAAGIAGVAYLAALVFLGARVERDVRESIAARLDATERIVSSGRSPAPGDPFAWTVFVRTDRALYVRKARWRDESSTQVKLASRLDEPEIARAAASDGAAAWRSFARFPIADIAPLGGAPTIFLMDARFQTAPSPTWSSTEIPLRAAVDPR